jgi:hypothetical protein
MLKIDWQLSDYLCMLQEPIYQISIYLPQRFFPDQCVPDHFFLDFSAPADFVRGWNVPWMIIVSSRVQGWDIQERKILGRNHQGHISQGRIVMSADGEISFSE